MEGGFGLPPLSAGLCKYPVIPPARSGLGGLAGAVVLLSAAVLPRAPAQGMGGAPIQQADTVVVEAAPQGDEALVPSTAVLDAALPVAELDWTRVTEQVPNLQVEGAGTSSFGALYTLRGLANTPYFSDPAVTVYFDDIPLGATFTYPTDLFGFGTASVFRGPQPTAFGRAGDGGVIVLTPSLSGAQAAGEIRASIGDYDARSGALEAAGPEGGGADGSVAVASSSREGYIENTQIHERVDDQRALSAFAREHYRLGAASELSVELLADRHRDGAAPLVPLDGPLYAVERSHEGETDSDLVGAAVKGTFDTGAGRFTSVTSYTNAKLNPYDDLLVLPPPLDSHLTQSQDAWNEELRLASESKGPFSWSLGAWLSRATNAGVVDRNIDGVVPLDATQYHSTTRDAAGFGEIVFLPAPLWRLSFGARVEDTAKDYHQREAYPTAGLRFDLRRSDAEFLPRVALSREVDPDTTASASVSFGSRPGGFSAYTDKPALIPFQPEHTAAFEAGLRHSSPDKSFVLAARAFDYEIGNYQIERSFSEADYFVANAPKARSLGAELEATWDPAPGWSLAIAAGRQDVTLLQFHDPLTGASHAGDRAPYAPAYTAGFSATFRSALGWFAACGIAATGKTFYTESEDPADAQAAYAVVNARIGLDMRGWRFTLYIENAADKGYYTLIIPGVNSAAPGIPRTVGGEWAVRF